VGLATVFDNSADDVSITFPSLFRSRRPKKRWESWQILWRQPSWIRRWWRVSHGRRGRGRTSSVDNE